VALTPVRTLPESPVPALTAEAETEDDWREVAACRDTDPDLFFPVGTTGPAIDQIEAAKAVCRECDAKAPCLDFALTSNQDSGIWGGTSEEERRKLRRQWLAARRRAS
jgi:WhiB family transcriptional regulator, redox-sensing transcriptional regulator